MVRKSRRCLGLLQVYNQILLMRMWNLYSLLLVGPRRNNQGWVDYDFNYKAAGVDKKVSTLGKLYLVKCVCIITRLTSLNSVVDVHVNKFVLYMCKALILYWCSSRDVVRYKIVYRCNTFLWYVLSLLICCHSIIVVS